MPSPPANEELATTPTDDSGQDHCDQHAGTGVMRGSGDRKTLALATDGEDSRSSSKRGRPTAPEECRSVARSHTLPVPEPMSIERLSGHLPESSTPSFPHS
jgi:hypothetical protein